VLQRHHASTQQHTCSRMGSGVNTLQHTTTPETKRSCSTTRRQHALGHTATHCYTLATRRPLRSCSTTHRNILQHTLQRTAEHLQYEGLFGLAQLHTITHCNTQCNTLQHTATRLQQGGLIGLAQLHTVTHCTTPCNTLQHTCNKKASSVLRDCASNTLQHTAAHCNTPATKKPFRSYSTAPQTQCNTL